MMGTSRPVESGWLRANLKVGRSEMRKQLLSVFLPLLVLVLMAAAETQNTGTARHATLQKVDVLHSADGISVEMTGRGLLKPGLSMVDSPARLVVDLPATVMATSQSRIGVGSDGVKGIHIGMDSQTPPMYTGASTAKTTTKPSLTAAVAPVPVAGTELAMSAPAPILPLQKKQVQTPSTATEFVFVEPSYKTKDAIAKEGSKTAEIAPADRAVNAAAKFADRPDTLLPAPSASMQPQASQGAAPTSGPQPAVNMAAEQKAQSQQSPAITGPKYTGEPISVNLKDVDLKDFFRLIHEISGLNVVLDPNVKGSLTIVLDDVPWDQALDIVLKNNELARQLDGNVLRIATVETLRKEAESRRAQQEAEALAIEKVTVTRFLSYAHSKDVVPTVKKFLTQRGDVISDDRTNALIIQDIPSIIPGIDRLLTQLDRKTQEVEIEARVVAATRSFARDIGTQFGFGWGNGPSAVGGASSVGTSPAIIGNTPNPLYLVLGAKGATQIPLFSNLPVTSPSSGISFVNASNNVRIDAILTLAESRGLLKILSRPRVVTQNNIQALVRQGVRVPIVTQAQLGGPPTVTYVDAFLRLTVIPQITSEGTIFLNVDVENTTPDFGRTVQGNPTLITQQATTQVLVTDGGTVVIGGVIQTQNSVNIAQVPLLGNIPALGNLFKRRSVSTSNQELIFFITPRIIQT
ncbi:MAG: hypothetical protein DMG86_13395 [Acidobacteria bacterium]|nr:MAG: hypothetical protein DMG86_13395 [Acidobacteriota bacterium]